MSVSAMDSRRRLVLSVVGGLSLSEACRQAGVTRKTGRKWVRRAQTEGISQMSERSRAPRVVARTPEHLEQALAAMKQRYPDWGAKKLVVKLKEHEGIELPLRTADRILARLGLTSPRPRSPDPEPVRFQRERCGALLQMDFKGLPASTPYSLLTVVDDYERFCLMFGPVPDKRGESVKAALWTLFGEHGLPDEMLMDNGDCWGGQGRSKGPTAFEAWLMRLAIRPIHGRPYHPQTQGKVERFHKTAVVEMGQRLVQPTIELAKLACDEFVSRYNWERPHEAIDMKIPGSLYVPWQRRRPDAPPDHVPEDGQIVRRVDQKGIFRFKGEDYYLGQGLYKESIIIKEAEFGMRVYYAGFPLPYLAELNHARSEK
jgi:transposase InsO family protein